MEFGKLTDITNIDFTLPTDHSENAAILRGAKMRRSADFLPRVYIGCTGWSMKEWVGWVYPKSCKSTDYLRFYSQQFNTIEMNTTHYRTPTIVDVEKWKRESTEDFRFAPKMLQTVSHSKNLGYGTGLTTQFCEAIQHFEEKLGICFMQMPPHFGAADVSIFEKYLTRFPKSIPIAVELRQAAIFNDDKICNLFFQLFEQYRVSNVITDVSGRRDVLSMRLTTPSVIVRFVGNDLHLTDYQRINDWVARLKTWFELGLEEVYFFTHEPDNLKAPHLAKYLAEQIDLNFKAVVRSPQFFGEGFTPVQTALW